MQFLTRSFILFLFFFYDFVTFSGRESQSSRGVFGIFMNPKNSFEEIKKFLLAFRCEQGVKNQSFTQFTSYASCMSLRLILEWNFSRYFWLHIFQHLRERAKRCETFLMHFFILFFNANKKAQCMKWMWKMQFRCIIKQFTYLNSFFGIPLFPFRTAESFLFFSSPSCLID